MSFSKNKELINRNGRPPGTKNKSTIEFQGILKSFLDNNLDRLQSDFDKLKPNERIKYTLQLCEFIIPKLKSTDVTIENTNAFFQPITIELNDLSNQ